MTYLIGTKLGGEWYWHQSTLVETDRNALERIREGYRQYIRFHEGKFQFMQVRDVPTRPGAKYLRVEGTWVDAGNTPPFAWKQPST
jgi:hypothetical protein